MTDASSAPEPTPPAPRAPGRGLPGWGWGLIVAGTAVVALLVGGGTGFGAGLLASHVGELRTSVIRPGTGLPGGIDRGWLHGNGGPATGHGLGGRSPGAPATPAPAPNS